jgi:hypothetical protein
VSARSGRGGRPSGLPKTGGRQKGTPNHATSELKQKLAALGCDPLAELVKIARDLNIPVNARVFIYSTLLPYEYPKRKPIDDSDGERASVNVATITPEEAVDLARELISVFGSRVTPQRELSAPVIEGEPSTSREESGDEE